MLHYLILQLFKNIVYYYIINIYIDGKIHISLTEA